MTLPDPAMRLCRKAIHVLSTFTRKVVNGSLTLSELKEVMCFESAVIINSMEQFYNVHLEQGTLGLPDWNHFVPELQRREKEYKAFIDRKEKLTRLMDHCQNVAPGKNL